MPNYIDQDALLAAYDAEHKGAPGRARKLIASAPAADVRPVVLCRDCKHRDPEDHKCDSGALERAGCFFRVGDDYYCADGERKEQRRGRGRRDRRK